MSSILKFDLKKNKQQHNTKQNKEKRKQLLRANGVDVGFQWVTDGLFYLGFLFPKMGPHGLDEGYPYVGWYWVCQ